MPPTYHLDLAGVSDKVKLYLWAYDGGKDVEYRGIFLYGYRGYLITVKNNGSLCAGNIRTDEGIVAESGGAYSDVIMDEKLNESWKRYILTLTKENAQ